MLQAVRRFLFGEPRDSLTDAWAKLAEGVGRIRAWDEKIAEKEQEIRENEERIRQIEDRIWDLQTELAALEVAEDD